MVVDWHTLCCNRVVFEHSSLSKTVGKLISPFITQLFWGALILILILVVAFSLLGIHPLAIAIKN